MTTRKRPCLLIIEDDEEIQTQMRWALSDDYDVQLAGDRESALARFERSRPALVTLDLGLPPHHFGEVEEGFRALTDLLHKDPYVKVIIITGRDEREYALKAIGQGAYDLFHKPVQMDELKVTLKRARQIYELEREHRQLERDSVAGAFERMIGESSQMQDVFGTIRKVATSDAPVLIQGESGSGKELVANAIHRQSTRSDASLVVINCGAIPETLLESELFGHEKGAFTGAHIQRKGRIELAHEGTLFLDEVGELPPVLQVKLLRFLQEGTLERVGGRESLSVDARVIAATNVDLQKAMAESAFREDLYYRLAVVVIRMPPLRERGGDIALLSEALLRRYTSEGTSRIVGFTPEAVTALANHNWPGNVRELENRIKRAVIMAEGQHITPADLELTTTEEAPIKGRGLKEARQALERHLVIESLARNKGNITRTAKELGVSRPTLYELMEKLGIRRD